MKLSRIKDLLRGESLGTEKKILRYMKAEAKRLNTPKEILRKEARPIKKAIKKEMRKVMITRAIAAGLLGTGLYQGMKYYANSK